MSGNPIISDQKWWMLIGILILGTVFWGGITRLHDAGLAIVEWAPVSGILPPLTPAQWEEAYASYSRIAQKELLFPDLTLKEFRKLYLLEYFHRLWARLVGLVIVLPFFLSWIPGSVGVRWRHLRWKSALLGVLVLIQATLGWLMVRSGIVEPRPWVDPRLLLVHHFFALGVFLLVNEWWIRVGGLASWGGTRVSSSLWFLLLIGVLVQFGYGTLMAGERASLVAPTYPDMGGSWLPPGLFGHHWKWSFLMESPVWVNFFHRHWGVLLAICCLILWIWRQDWFTFLAMGFTGIQVTLGIVTLLLSRGDIPVLPALTHQIVGWLTTMVIYWGWRVARLHAVPSSTTGQAQDISP